jgi:gp16 family phage-associated protein
MKLSLLKNIAGITMNLDIFREQFKAQLRKERLTIKTWAEARGYNPDTVSMLLNGQIKGLYGKSRKIAIDMGLVTPYPHENFKDYTAGKACVNRTICILSRNHT